MFKGNTGRRKNLLHFPFSRIFTSIHSNSTTTLCEKCEMISKSRETSFSIGRAEPVAQVSGVARTHLAKRVSFIQVEVALHEYTGGPVDGSKHQAALMTRNWCRKSKRETPSQRERERQREVKRGRRSLTGADREVGDVLVPEAVLVGGAVGQQAKSRTADHCHLGPVVRLLQQPLSGQLVVIEGAAAKRVRGQTKVKGQSTDQ